MFRTNLLARVAPAAALAGLVLAGVADAGLYAGSAGASTVVAPSDSPTQDDSYDNETDLNLSAAARLGKVLFFDKSLSGSGQMACSSCHDPSNHYAPPNKRVVQLGGPKLDQPGIRPVPSLTYKYLTHAFSIGPESPNEVEGPATPATLVGSAGSQPKAASAAPDIVPEGGFFWDGRADTLEDQAQGPLFSPFEMANTDRHAVYERIKAGYGPQIGKLFGKQVLDDPEMVLAEASFALARYQIEAPDFHAFTSKYDYYLKGQAKLSPAEARGLKLFDDPKKGNCSSCHLDTTDADGHPPVFTDYEYEALGVPRNPKIPANANPAYHDLGICGPLRSDAYAGQPQNCGLFKTPTLRNAATRPVFFHNGRFTTLEEVVKFYVRRDTNPGAFYPKGKDGKVEKYDDLPADYRGNIDTVDAPLDRKPGQKPALNGQEIKDVVAFLGTLTDGWRSPVAGPSPSSDSSPSQK
jgi:cytochrome c peroxidase